MSLCCHSNCNTVQEGNLKHLYQETDFLCTVNPYAFPSSTLMESTSILTHNPFRFNYIISLFAELIKSLGNQNMGLGFICPVAFADLLAFSMLSIIFWFLHSFIRSPVFLIWLHTMRCGFCMVRMKTCPHTGPFRIRSDTSGLRSKDCQFKVIP